MILCKFLYVKLLTVYEVATLDRSGDSSDHSWYVEKHLLVFEFLHDPSRRQTRSFYPANLYYAVLNRTVFSP